MTRTTKQLERLNVQQTQVQQTWAGCLSTFYQLLINFLWTFYQLFINVFINFLSTFYQLFINFLPTFYQLFINFISTLSTFYQRLINFLSTFYQLFINFLPTLYQLFINFLSTFLSTSINFLSTFSFLKESTSMCIFWFQGDSYSKHCVNMWRRLSSGNPRQRKLCGPQEKVQNQWCPLSCHSCAKQIAYCLPRAERRLFLWPSHMMTMIRLQRARSVTCFGQLHLNGPGGSKVALR